MRHGPALRLLHNFTALNWEGLILSRAKLVLIEFGLSRVTYSRRGTEFGLHFGRFLACHAESVPSPSNGLILA